MSTITRQMILSRWFPPDDKFATCVARLCILREDLALEMEGIHAEDLSAMDGNTPLWRRVYFWRNYVATVEEIRQTVDTLFTVAEFKNAVKNQPTKWTKEFNNIVKLLRDSRELVKKLRDSVGGHVLHQTVEKALRDIEPDAFSYLDAGQIAKKTHYRFTNDLVLGMTLAGIPDKRRIAEIKRQFRKTAQLLPVFHLTDLILTLYAETRHL